MQHRVSDAPHWQSHILLTNLISIRLLTVDLADPAAGGGGGGAGGGGKKHEIYVAAIFFMIYFYRAGEGHGPRAPPWIRYCEVHLFEQWRSEKNPFAHSYVLLICERSQKIV